MTVSKQDPYKPVSWEDYEAEKEARHQERLKKRKTLMRCLDAAYAAQLEGKKDIFDWKVTAEWYGPAPRGGVERYAEERIVSAHHEDDAWAVFCDKIKRHPSRASVDVKITKLKPTK